MCRYTSSQSVLAFASNSDNLFSLSASLFLLFASFRLFFSRSTSLSMFPIVLSDTFDGTCSEGFDSSFNLFSNLTERRGSPLANLTRKSFFSISKRCCIDASILNSGSASYLQLALVPTPKMSLSMSNNSIRLFNAPFSVSRWAGTGGSGSSLLKASQSLCNEQACNQVK